MALSNAVVSVMIPMVAAIIPPMAVMTAPMTVIIPLTAAKSATMSVIMWGDEAHDLAP
jgi:hypothetical protein